METVKRSMVAWEEGRDEAANRTKNSENAPHNMMTNVCHFSLPKEKGLTLLFLEEEKKSTKT